MQAATSLAAIYQFYKMIQSFSQNEMCAELRLFMALIVRAGID